jgi:hypothetical protein
LSQGRPLLWRATRQIAASLIATIFAQPTLKKLRQTLGAVKYRLREPPRMRKFQYLPVLS